MAVEGGVGKVVYEEAGGTVTFPPTAPPEGIPNVGDARIYRGTVDLVSHVVAQRFYAHPAQ